MNAGIILIGTELLNGAMIDTNSLYIAQELNKIGVELKYKLICRDFQAEIISALSFLKNNVDLVITTGGLGPTDDDVTKDAIAKFLNKKLITEESEVLELKEKFKKIKSNFILSNFKEVEKPEGAISFKNDVGMAPAIYIDDIVAFPGVPRELKNMLPKFLNYFSSKNNLKDKIYIKDILTFGKGEAELEDTVKDLFVDENIYYEFLVKSYATLIRMQYKETEKKSMEKIKEKLYNRISEFIFGEDDDRLETLVYKKLKEKNYRISLAESCSGGLLASRLIEVSGISKFLKESLVTYSNESKVKRLRVSKETLAKYGAVSKEVAREMIANFDTEVAISITGIAGPNGATKDKPVGLVYIAIKVNDEVEVIKNYFNGDRNRIREKSVMQALFVLLKKLK